MIGKAILAAAAIMTGGAAQAQYVPYAYPSTPYPQAPYPQPPQPYVAYGEVPADTRVFTGLRVEAHLSYERLGGDLTDSAVAGGRSGLGYGGEVGFDLPLGGLILGAYAGADGSTTRYCVAAGATATDCIRPGRSLLAGVRLGVPVGRAVMLYAKGGYTNGQLRVDARDTDPTGINGTFRVDLDGFHAGGGVEAAFSPRTYGRVEYIYTRLRERGTGNDDPLTVTRSQVQAGLGLRF